MAYNTCQIYCAKKPTDKLLKKRKMQDGGHFQDGRHGCNRKIIFALKSPIR